MTLCFTSRKLWRIMLRAAGPIVGRIYRYYIMYKTTIKFQFSFLIQKRVLFYSLTQRSLPTSWGTWTSPERIGKRAKIFILKGLELFKVVEVWRAETNFAIEWFTRNLMLAKPLKFQALLLNCKEENFTFDPDNVTIIADDAVKLLGVHLDSKLNFE